MLRLITMSLLTLALCASASADYILTPLVDGESSAIVDWGDSFTFDLVLTSDAGDVNDSAIFRLGFTEPGLIYESYEWGDPYLSTPPYDDSTPLLAELPLAIDQDVFVDPANPSLIDIELSNVLIGDTFSAGTLISLSVTVPIDYGYEGSIYIFAMVDTIGNGFDEIPTTAGPVFELMVVPEPATFAALVLASLVAVRRGR